MPIKTEYTKDGLKLTHPTGVVQVLSIKDLTRLKVRIWERQTENATKLAHLNTHIENANSAKNIEG